MTPTTPNTTEKERGKKKSDSIVNDDLIQVILPGDGDFHFGFGNSCRPYCSFDGSVHLLLGLGVFQWDQVLLDAPGQCVVLVLPFFLGAIRKDGTAVAMTLVIQPLALILHAVGALRNAETAALVILPLTHVGLSGGGVHVVFLSQVVVARVSIAKADGGVGVAGADATHGGVAVCRAALAGNRGT